jgi:ATPase family associated with various cellular activities (AAA)
MSDPIPSLGLCNARQVREYVEDLFEAGLVPFIKSSPGAGKSSIVRMICKHFGLFLIDIRLSTAAQEDLTGLPTFYTGTNGRTYARFAPFAEQFPLEGLGEPPPGYNGWCIFFDEFNSAKEELQAACYKVILDKMIGQEKLDPRVVMVCAGNLDTDRAITNQIGTAMQSRLVTMEMYVDFTIWLEDVALPEMYDHRIIGFLSRYNKYLMDFKPDHNEKTFCCPRTWDFMNRLVKGREFQTIDGQFQMIKKVPMYAGTITAGVATEFVHFCQIMDEVIELKDILADPDNCPVPTDLMHKWATISVMMDKITEKNFSDLSAYADRFEMNFRVLFYRSVLARHKKLVSHPAYGKAALGLAKYLGGGSI